MSERSMVENGCLLGLDLGTSAIKGVVMDARGTVLAEADRAVTLIHPREGWVELDPEAHYRDVCGVIRELAAAAPGPIAALAMAAASGNTVLTDREGRPLTKIISWLDQRAVQEAPVGVELPPLETIHQVVGWPYSGGFPLAHLAWLKTHRPARYEAAAHYAMNTDWLLFRLSGKWRMDHSTATTFFLQDQVAGRYHEPFLKALGLSADGLSPLSASGVGIGTPTPEAVTATGLSPRTRIVTGCFDHPAAARAFGVLAPRRLMLSCGTSWVGFFPEEQRQRIIDAGLLCDPFLSERAGPWGAIFSVPMIGRTIDWYVKEIIAPGEANPYRVFNERAAAAKAGAGGLRIDLRKAGHAVSGGVENISRAVMEGAANLLNERIAGLRARGIAFEEAVMVGGPTKSSVWPGIVEAITGIHLTIGSRHAGARGAAMLAGMGAGWYADEQDAWRRTRASEKRSGGEGP